MTTINHQEPCGRCHKRPCLCKFTYRSAGDLEVALYVGVGGMPDGYGWATADDVVEALKAAPPEVRLAVLEQLPEHKAAIEDTWRQGTRADEAEALAESVQASLDAAEAKLEAYRVFRGDVAGLPSQSIPYPLRQRYREALHRLDKELATKPQEPARPVCERCNDTHVVETERGKQSCTSCPTPCQKCRRGGIGAYCETPHCECACHKDSPSRAQAGEDRNPSPVEPVTSGIVPGAQGSTGGGGEVGGTPLCKSCFHHQHEGDCPKQESYWMLRMRMEQDFVPKAEHERAVAKLHHQLGKAQGEADGHRLVRQGLQQALLAAEAERDALARRVDELESAAGRRSKLS